MRNRLAQEHACPRQPGSRIRTQNHCLWVGKCPDPGREGEEVPWPLATLPDSTFAESVRPNLISISGFHFPPRTAPPAPPMPLCSLSQHTRDSPSSPKCRLLSSLLTRRPAWDYICVFIYNGLESSLKCFPAERWESLFKGLKSPART